MGERLGICIIWLIYRKIVKDNIYQTVGIGLYIFFSHKYNKKGRRSKPIRIINDAFHKNDNKKPGFFCFLQCAQYACISFMTCLAKAEVIFHLWALRQWRASDPWFFEKNNTYYTRQISRPRYLWRAAKKRITITWLKSKGAAV